MKGSRAEETPIGGCETPVLGAELLEGLGVAEVRTGCTLRLQTWEALDDALACGFTVAEAGDFGVSGSSAERLLDRYGWLAGELGFSCVSVPLQVHGSEIVARDEAPPEPPGRPVCVSLAGRVDGQTTSTRGWLLASTAADCVPIYLWEGKAGRLGLIHAGWRGVAAGILASALERMRRPEPESRGARDAPILIHLGPAICGRCYEVDEPVLSALGLPGERALVDLRGILVGQAARAGLGRRSISVSEHCTVCGAEALHSHRGSGGTAGRAAAYIGLRAPDR